jgi:hypothetical protein
VARSRVLSVTLYLDEAYKGPEHSYQLWNQLAALDFVILEEHTKAGVIQGEYFGEDTKILEKVPGVAALLAKEAEIKFDTPTARPLHKRAA